MDEWTKKTPNLLCRLFFKIDLLTDFAALCLTDFIDWRYIHSWFVFSTQLVNSCTHGLKELYLCTVAPLPSLWSPLPLPPSQTKCTVYTSSMCGWGGGGGDVKQFYTLFLTRFRTYKIATPPQTKMTSKDDIKGFMSLKFLRPWCSVCAPTDGSYVGWREMLGWIIVVYVWEWKLQLTVGGSIVN